jgi:CRISPR-associated endonuclease/helicase Cas3
MQEKLSSFSEITGHKLPSITNIIPNISRYWAHIDGANNRYEILQDHVELVLSYAKSIVEDQKIDTIIDHLCNQVAKENQTLAEYIKLLFSASIAYHDLGKINPNFQVLKMQNNLFKEKKISIGSQHSLLSAVLFLHYFIEKVNFSNFEPKEKELLFGIIILFCIPILKHHSSVLSNENHFSVEIFEELFSFVEYCNINLPFEASTKIIHIKDKLIERISQEQHFSIFALLKLSYSLLTASDYYATNEYMADIKVNDFGIIDETLRNKISNNFKTKLSYNKDLFNNFEKYQKKPFSELQEVDQKNLNFLRQKLNAEVISSIRQEPDNPWYYIEAPTGAGKTNLSLACISELLQSDQSLNKVFYVFPFTTLITQTFEAIKKTIGLNNDELIQLHSKAGFHEKEEHTDGEYGKEKKLHLDNLFVNYPVCVTSHIRFFEILKGNNKESNYLLHRLCNSIVVIDELQTYNPRHWDKIVFFIENYARPFNIRFIIMSATLPKIDALSETLKGRFVNLTPNKKQYFSNKNFAGRIEFDFLLLKKPKPSKENKEEYLTELAYFIKHEADDYSEIHHQARVLIEFITKNTASHFFRLLSESDVFQDYKLYLLSGDILEPQRKKIINEIKEEKYKKVIVASTQVVEAGIDIDMDLGFKDRSILDSDEQLAGRINRNASKKDCKVFLFDCDRASTIYGKDKRYQHQQKNKELYFGFKEILQKKEFDRLYEKVFEDAKKDDWTDSSKLKSYLENFKRFDFSSISQEFQLIENNNAESLFIPVEIPIPDGYSSKDLRTIDLLTDDQLMISGEKLFDRFIDLIHNKDIDFIRRQMDLKKLTGLMSLFSISVYPNLLKEIGDKLDVEKSKYGYQYLSHWESCYNINSGFNLEMAREDVLL